MADLKDIRGTRVQSFASDLSSPGSANQLFYNSTSDIFKFARVGTVADGTWASGGTPNAARSFRGGAGAQTAALHYGGFNPTSTTRGETETYNGTAWSEVADLNTSQAAFVNAQQGTQTAAQAASGTTGPSDTTNNELWDGSSWTESTNLNGSHSYSAGAGTQTASITAGSQPPTRALTETWDGSSWTEVSDLNTGRYFTAAAGSQTAALCFSGDTVPNAFTNKTESWDGTAWTEVNDLNTTRATGGGFGTQTTALMCTGNTYPPIVANVENWNGSSWSEINDVATGRIRIASSGSSGAAGLIGGGQTPPIVGNVEEFTASAGIATVTTSQLTFQYKDIYTDQK